MNLGELKNLAKNHGFEYGPKFVRWSIENRILPNPTDINRKHNERTAKRAGYSNHAEYEKQNFWNRGATSPMSDNEYCALYFGIEIAERYVSALFENPIRMPNGNPGFDWICKNGYKIQNKARCLDYIIGKTPRYAFGIRYNNIADYFILSGWNNREDLMPMYMWLISKDEIIRGKELWKRETLSITNNFNGIRYFKRFELQDKLEKLKNICDNK